MRRSKMNLHRKMITSFYMGRANSMALIFLYGYLLENHLLRKQCCQLKKICKNYLTSKSKNGTSHFIIQLNARCSMNFSKTITNCGW